MNALQARIKMLTVTQIADAIVMLGRNGTITVRVAGWLILGGA